MSTERVPADANANLSPPPPAPALPARTKPLKVRELAGMEITHKAPHRWPMILIGVGKILKATGLIIVGFGLHWVIGEPYHSNLERWLEWAGQDPHSHVLFNGINWVMGISIAKLKLFRIGVFVYASPSMSEGAAGLLKKRGAASTGCL